MTDEWFAGGAQGDGPFQLRKWSCLPSDLDTAYGDVMGDCIHHPCLHQSLQVLHQMKGMLQ